MGLITWLVLNVLCITSILTATVTAEVSNIGILDITTSIEDNRLESDNDPSLVVETASGNVSGINLQDNVQAWLGIPYAEPPLGKL